MARTHAGPTRVHGGGRDPHQREGGGRLDVCRRQLFNTPPSAGWFRAFRPRRRRRSRRRSPAACSTGSDRRRPRSGRVPARCARRCREARPPSDVAGNPTLVCPGAPGPACSISCWACWSELFSCGRGAPGVGGRRSKSGGTVSGARDFDSELVGHCRLEADRLLEIRAPRNHRCPGQAQSAQNNKTAARAANPVTT